MTAIILPLKLGKTQVQTLAAAASGFTSNVGSQSYAVMLSVTGQNVTIAVSPGGRTAAASGTGPTLKATDPPLMIGVSPGDNVSCLGSGATVTMTELSR